jgi:hypothetical protein
MSTITLTDPYGLWTFIGTMALAGGTIILAIITYWSTGKNQESSKQERRLAELKTMLNEYYGPLVFLLGQGNNTDCIRLVDILRTKSYLKEDSALNPLFQGCGLSWQDSSKAQYCIFTSPKEDLWLEFYNKTWDSYIKIKKQIASITGTEYSEEEKPPYKMEVASSGSLYTA